MQCSDTTMEEQLNFLKECRAAFAGHVTKIS